MIQQRLTQISGQATDFVNGFRQSAGHDSYGVMDNYDKVTGRFDYVSAVPVAKGGFDASNPTLCQSIIRFTISLTVDHTLKKRMVIGFRKIELIYNVEVTARMEESSNIKFGGCI